MRIGIDVGGSHIGVGLVDEFGKILLKKECNLKDKTNLTEEKIVIYILKFIEEILEQAKLKIGEIKFIGIAYPAKLQDGKMGIAVNLKLDGEKIKNILADKVKLPVYIKNDAKCAGICEKKYGALKLYSNAVFLTVGTGIGGAYFYNNELFGDSENENFEVGHMVIKSDGIKCNCGRNGCFEKYASISALKKQIIKEYKLDKEITGLELYDFILQKLEDEKMNCIIDKYIESLSIGIINLVNLFETEVICIGGSFTYYDIFLQKLMTKLNNNDIILNRREIKVILAINKNDAGIIGAANIV